VPVEGFILEAREAAEWWTNRRVLGLQAVFCGDRC